jgi:two-component system, cell cycle sensor histidine kinase and response regulator CckA
MDANDYQTLRQLFDDYLQMYSSRDDRLTTYFSEDFSGITGSGDFLVKDREEWVAITRQDFAQVKDPIRIELKDLIIQSLADTVAVATSAFTIHLPIKDHVLSRKTARLVLIFRKESAGWKISHSSISIPFGMAHEGEVYPLKELEERNLYLEELVAERTSQLSDVNDKLLRANEALAREIAEHKLAEEMLRESETHYRLLADEASDVIWKLDSEYRFTYISPADERLRGYRADEVIGRHVFEFLSTEGIAVLKKTTQKRMDAEQHGIITGTTTFEAQHQCKDGRWIWVEISSTPKRAADGSIAGFYGISREITERKEREKELLKIEKLESLGALAGGIAHDFNNILTGIMGNISFAQMFLDVAHKSYKPLAEAEKASARASELAHQLLTFARGGEPIKKVVSLQHLVNETVSLVLRGSNVKGIIDIPDSIHAIEADEGQLNQVFHNIIINATQAMPGGGTLTVTGQNEKLEDMNDMRLPEGSYVRISFADQGCGITDGDLKRIFDPYFTTKSSGTGLGLASANSIVNRHGGHIGVSSVTGVGTTFTIHFPSTGEAYGTHQPDTATQNAGEHAGGSILVMDDEEIIREMTTEILGFLGYQVIACKDGAEAITRYREAMESGTPISAVIMDLTIPGGMGGKEAAEQILAIDPAACLIVSSGYSNDPIMSDFTAYGFMGAIAKPYNITEFEQLLSSIVSAR